MEIIVINTRVDWTCSGGSSIAAAFEVAYALNQQERQGGSSDRMVIAAAAGPCEIIRLWHGPMAASSAWRQRLPRRISRCHKNEMIQHINSWLKQRVPRSIKDISNARTGCLPSSMSLQVLKEVT